MDVIKEFYSQKTTTVGGASGDVATPLVDMELRSIRAALFDALKLYVKEDVKKEEVGVMVAFLASCPDPVVVSSSHLGVLTCLPLSQQEELLQLVHELLIDSAQSKSLGSLLCSVGQPIIALVQSESTAVRFLAIKVLLTCYTEEGDCTMAVGGVERY